jgi:hypothetical protein
LQHLRHNYTPIGLLVALQYGDENTRQGKTRAIEGMDKLRSGARGWSIANIGAAGLEIAAITATTDLQPLSAAGGPHLDIIGFGSRKTEVSGAQLRHSIREVQSPADLLGIPHQLLQLVTGALRRDELI